MDTARDLAGGDPWRESLERSRARRQRPRQAPSAPRPWRDRVVAALAVIPTVGPRGVAGLALAAAILASSLASGGSQASPSAARATAARISHGAPRAGTPIGPVRSSPARCPLAVTPTGYANPLAGATVKPERVDQGVDYAGSGTLVAIGAGRITYLGTTNTGWPGAFIAFQLLGGADAGCYVYYAEGVVPADGLAVGQTVIAGQPIATIIPKYPTGIELGWGSGRGTKALAKVTGQWSTTDDEDNVATTAGKSFSALIAALGGPPGKVEG